MHTPRIRPRQCNCVFHMILGKTVIISLYNRVQCEEGARILYITWSNTVSLHQISTFIWILTLRQSDGRAGEHWKHCSFEYGGTTPLRCISAISEVRILDSKPNLIPLLEHHHHFPPPTKRQCRVEEVNANYKRTESKSTHAQNCTQFLRDDSAHLFKKLVIGITLKMWEPGFNFPWHKESWMDAYNQGNITAPWIWEANGLGGERSQSAADVTVSSPLNFRHRASCI